MAPLGRHFAAQRRLAPAKRAILSDDPLHGRRGRPSPRRLPWERPPSLMAEVGGAGMSTGCPSPTPNGLGLGPPNPTPTSVASETLGFRRAGFSPALSLLVPGFSLPPAPPVLSVGLHSRRNAPLPPDGRQQSYQSAKPAASVPGLAPLNLPRRTPRPVSCYALFKGWLLLSQPPGCLRGSTAFPTEPGLGDLSGRSGLFPSRLRNLSPGVRLPGLSPIKGPAAAFGVGRGSVGC